MTEEQANVGERQVVVFSLGAHAYGLAIHAVREIIRMQPVTRVPNAPRFIEGVINLRGKICPVMDLRARFGLDPVAATAENRIVVVEIDGADLGLIVDAVTEVLRLAEADVQAPSESLAAGESRVVEAIANVGERLVLIVDPARLLDGEALEAATEAA